MREVMISIKPRWVELIASGKKTVEVRKTRPKCETPFKCYIYETKDREFENIGVCGHKADGTPYIYKHNGGKVIGEFICDKIIDSFLNNNDGWFVELGCLTPKEIDEYQGDKAILYGWHITDLVVYDEPRELGEFSRFVEGVMWSRIERIKRPYQSWGYVEATEQRQTAD